MKAFWTISLVFALAGAARSQEIRISWDQELAFEGDRENYQKLLSGIATRGVRTVSSGLGIKLERPLQLKVYSPVGYQKKFGRSMAAFSGAHYSRGVVNVNGGNRLNDRFAGLLEHEISHAFADHRGTGRALPTWLNEGLAERFRWRRMGMRGLAPNQVNELKQAIKSRKLTPLPARGRLSPYGYLQCYAAVLFLEKKYGEKKLLQLLHQTLKSGPFPRVLKQLLKQEISHLEREFTEWVEDLE